MDPTFLSCNDLVCYASQAAKRLLKGTAMRKLIFMLALGVAFGTSIADEVLLGDGFESIVQANRQDPNQNPSHNRVAVLWLGWTSDTNPTYIYRRYTVDQAGTLTTSWSPELAGPPETVSSSSANHQDPTLC